MLFQLLKNASKWVFNYIEDSGRKMNESEERLFFWDRDKNEEI